MATEPWILVEAEGSRGELVLNRPEKRNAMHPEMFVALNSGLDKLLADPEVKVIVLRSAGSFFCAGHDLKALAEGISPELRKRRIDFHMALYESPKPVIGALEGKAIAAGAALALTCDFLVVGERATLAVPEVAMNMVAWLIIALLNRRIGEARALEMTLDARSYTGRELYERGLATAVVPDEQVLEETRKLADRLAGHNGPSMAKTKRLIHETSALGDIRTYLSRAQKTLADLG
jgi:enoyl-CoA hydratase/carnithine racemase